MERGRQVGNYIVEEELGAGGMARVYRVQHTALGTLHALKVLEPRFRVVAEVRARFLAEARIQASLLHDNIVRVTDTVSTPDIAGFVMELVDGSTLEQHIGAMARPLTLAELRAIFLPILDALGEAHRRGVVHRDIKPANILLAKTSRGMVPKLADFGIAKITQPPEGGARNASTHFSDKMGTLAYMSPEQIERAKSVTQRSDIFSMGATLYEAATGTVAFEGHSDFEVMRKIVDGRFIPPTGRFAGIDPCIAAAIMRALKPAAEARFASCEEFAHALEAAPPSSQQLLAPGPQPPPRTPPSPFMVGLFGPSWALLQTAAQQIARGPAPTDQTISNHLAMIRAEPLTRIDSYRELFNVYMGSQSVDKAWCIAAALAFLHRADATELHMHELFRAKRLPQAKQRLTDSSWNNILHPSVDGQISTILGSIWNSVALIKAQPHKNYGLRRKDKLDAATHQSLVAKIFNYVNQVIGLPQPELYLAPDKPILMSLANTAEKMQLLPSFVVGSEMLSGRSDAEITFVIASRLAYMRPEHFLKLAIPTVAEIRIVLLAALRLAIPILPISKQDEPAVDQYVGAMRILVEPRKLEALRVVALRFIQNKGDVDLNRWSNGVELTAHRLGFILCGDLATAAKIISQEPANAGGMQPKEKVVELLMYPISDQYSEVRRQLGMAVT